MHPNNSSNRLLSLDFLRGLIMVLLAMESTGLYENLNEATNESGWMQQFFHHPWNGLHFWDLIQPGFMFIAGTAMAFSLTRQQEKGVSWNEQFLKILKRSGWLFFWGVLNYAVHSKGLSFELWNVLTQLSFTTLVTFLVFKWSLRTQLVFCVGLLVLTEVLYRFTGIPGFDQPFTDQHNFGNYIDLVLMNKTSGGGWVAINCIPTAVHTIAGAMAGKWLLKKNPVLLWIWIAGIVSLLLGFGLDWGGVTPIIKRIATSSFTLVSLGWCLLALGTAYWWIDQNCHPKNLQFFTIVGMNSIFIYLFFEIVGGRWFNVYISSISNGLMELVHVPEALMKIISSLIIFSLEWLLCYWLYKKKIFFKL